LDDLAQSARSHGVRVLYAVRDIPLPPADCAAASARADLLVHMRREFTSRASAPFAARSTSWSSPGGMKIDKVAGIEARGGIDRDDNGAAVE